MMSSFFILSAAKSNAHSFRIRKRDYNNGMFLFSSTWKIIGIFLCAMNSIYVISIIYYSNFMSQIYSFSVKYNNTHRADLRFQMCHVSDLLFLLNDKYLNATANQNLNSTAIYYTYIPYDVKISSYYVGFVIRHLYRLSPYFQSHINPRFRVLRSMIFALLKPIQYPLLKKSASLYQKE